MPLYICNHCGNEAYIGTAANHDEHEPCDECGEMMDIVEEATDGQ